MLLMPRSATHNQTWRAVLAEIREHAKRTGTGRFKLLRKLDELEHAVIFEIDALDEARRRRIIGPRARVRAAIYTVEESPRGPALTERRDSDARPFKCPKPIYDAVAAAVGVSPKPRSFQAIKAHVESRLDEPLADYAVRTPLRFWSLLGLIHHEQARFTRVGTKVDFIRSARSSWREASSAAVETLPD